ncbi:hypothetical protein ACFS5N_10475 [Mucilaginibacter ximonensis]|uniref:Universal stress protein family protein n=1 Tax=Mucilaginibacter ximonensis TaxID=538021 RepID=A0ABW5YBX6_9SPHI
MKKIILINDGSTAVDAAAKMAFQIAGDMQAEILIVQTYNERKTSAVKMLAGLRTAAVRDTQTETNRLVRMLQYVNEGRHGYQPSISATSLKLTDAAGMAELALRTNCWLIIRGCGQMPAGQASLDFQSLLDRLRCPLLLVPEGWATHPIRRITYMADVRYCQVNIMRYLANWAIASKAGLSLAHFSKNGLPPIAESYGLGLFADIVRQLPACSLTFNNIRDPDIHKATDVLINGLHSDLFVLVNRRYHFKEIIGDRLTDKLPEDLGIPLLFFPL